MTEKTLYVIAPAKSDPSWQHKRSITREVAKGLGFECYYPDYNFENPSFELDAEIEVLSRSQAAIVDLSLERPSCYYELGIIEVLQVPIIVIAERDTPIHQTSNRSRVIFYDNLDDYRTQLGEAISQMIKQ